MLPILSDMRVPVMSRILVPDYFEDFHCKCGDCRYPCCDGWGINVDEHEYFSLLGLACSTRLRHKLDDAFVVSELPTEAAYASIRPNYLGQCPMLDEDGLCLLQKEQGERVLPLICRVYPRAVKKYGDLHEICMSCSCEETVELLLRSTAPLTLHEIDAELPFDGMEVYGKDPEKDRIRHGAIAVMSDPDVPFGHRLGLVGCAVTGDPLLPEGTRTAALTSLVRLLTMLCGVSRSMHECAASTLAYLGDAQGDELLRRFDAAEAHLHRLLPDAEATAGRIVANHMLYESFPFVPDCESPDTAFAAFCTAVAMLKCVCVCGTADTEDPHVFTDLLAFANRFVEHSDFYRLCSRIEHPRGMETFARFAPIFRTENERGY